MLMNIKDFIIILCILSSVFCTDIGNSSISQPQNTTQQDCSICLNEVIQEDKPLESQFTCEHNTFHETCLSTWIATNRNSKCPICRADRKVARVQTTPKLTSRCSSMTYQNTEKRKVLGHFKLNRFDIGSEIANHCRFSNATMLEFFIILVKKKQWNIIQQIFDRTADIDFQIFVPTLNSMNDKSLSRSITTILEHSSTTSRSSQIEFHKVCLVKKYAECNYRFLHWYSTLSPSIEIGASNLDVSLRVYLQNLRIIPALLILDLINCPRTLFNETSIGESVARLLKTKIKYTPIFGLVISSINRLTIPTLSMRSALINTLLKQDSELLTIVLHYTHFTTGDIMESKAKLGRLTVFEKLTIKNTANKLEQLNRYGENVRS